MATTFDYNRDYAAGDATDNFKRRNSTFNKFKRTMGGYGTDAGRKYNRATSGVKSATAPMRETLKNSVNFAKNNKLKIGGNVITPLYETYSAYDDINSGYLKGSEKSDRVKEGVARSAASAGGSIAGAKLGARLGMGIPVWHPVAKGAATIAGGAAGYFAPELIEGMANKFGVKTNELPSQKVARLRAENQPNVVASQAGAPNQDQAQEDADKAGSQMTQNNLPMVVNNQPWKTNAPAPKPQGNETINNSQQQVNAALAKLAETLKAPADAGTLGDIVAQKSRNKTAMELLRATLQATGANNQGQIDQSRIAQGDQSIAADKQNMKLRQFDIDQKQQLAETMKQFEAAEGNERSALRDTLLTMMGKQPDSPYKFMKVNDGVNGERVIVANAQTGQVQDNGQAATPQYEDVQIVQFPDGSYRKFNAEKQAFDLT